MGNESKVKRVSAVEDAPGTDAIVRKMAKRALPDLQRARCAAGGADEQPRDEDTMQRLIRSNLLKAAELRPASDVPADAASK